MLFSSRRKIEKTATTATSFPAAAFVVVVVVFVSQLSLADKEAHEIHQK